METTPAAVFAQHLQSHANQYFPELGDTSVDVRLLGQRNRAASVFYRYEVVGVDKKVLVKMPFRRGERFHGENGHMRRPRLAPKTDSADKCRLEYEALSMIHAYFSELNDPRFGTIHTLDFFPDERAVMMVEHNDPNLRKLFGKTALFRLPAASKVLRAPFENAGAWLQRYHRMPVRDPVRIRHAQRADFVKTIEEYCDFLVRMVGNALVFQELFATVDAYASAALPDSLPLGLGHGDYAMRNILVGTDDRVTVLDTLAKWQTPIYEDISYFLAGIKTTSPHTLSQGLLFSAGVISDCERAFLSGYFDADAIPMRVIRLFEIQAMLDKWSSMVVRLGQKRGTKAPFARLYLALANRYFTKRISYILEDIEAGVDRWTTTTEGVDAHRYSTEGSERVEQQ